MYREGGREAGRERGSDQKEQRQRVIGSIERRFVSQGGFVGRLLQSIDRPSGDGCGEAKDGAGEVEGFM